LQDYRCEPLAPGWKNDILNGAARETLNEGHQTLVFSHSRQILNIIECLLKNKHVKTLQIDGTVTQLWEREKKSSAIPVK
jgi:SNF2 family DNA or RNA helicase